MDKEQLKRFFEKHKMLIFLVVGLSIIVFALFSQEKPKKKPKSKEPTKIEETTKKTSISTKEEYLPLLLEEESKKKAASEEEIKRSKSLVIETEGEKKSKSKTLLLSSSSKKRKTSGRTSRRRPSRPLTSVEKTFQIYSYYSGPIKDLSLEAKAVSIKNEAETAKASAESARIERIRQLRSAKEAERSAVEQTAQASEKETFRNVKRSIILPGAIIKGVLLTQIVAPEDASVHFVSKVLSVSNSDVDFSGCYAVGRARFNRVTKKIDAELISIACRDKFVPSLSAIGYSEDLSQGLDPDEYHSKILVRSFYRFLSEFAPTYFSARAEAEQYNSSRVTNEGSTTVVDYKIQNPEKYSLFRALDSWGRSLQFEFNSLIDQNRPTAIKYALSKVYFLTQNVAEVVFLKD